MRKVLNKIGEIMFYKKMVIVNPQIRYMYNLSTKYISIDLQNINEIKGKNIRLKVVGGKLARIIHNKINVPLTKEGVLRNSEGSTSVIVSLLLHRLDPKDVKCEVDVFTHTENSVMYGESHQLLPKTKRRSIWEKIRLFFS